MTLLRLLAALAATLAFAAGAGATTWQQVYPLQAQKTFAIESEGVTVTVAPPPPYPGDEVGPDEFQASYEDSAITVTFPGMAPFAVPTDRYRSSPYGISVGIGRMAPGDPAPTVLLAGHSGGAHCCATLQAVSLVDGQPVSAILPLKDGAPLERFPEDIDGDGVRDFRWIDNSLLYAFSSYAASRPVPRIYNLQAGAVTDVSRQPRFGAIYRKFARKVLAECRERDVESAAPCAAYAYAMAVQGRAEEGIRTAVSLAPEPVWYPSDCLVDTVDDMCPDDQWRQFAGFEDALRWIMRRNGYLPGS
jgi:hypothetical protein